MSILFGSSSFINLSRLVLLEFRNYCCVMLVTNAKRERFPKHFSVKFFFS